MGSTRLKDNEINSIMTKYTVDNFFKTFGGKLNIINDRERQLKGLDYICEKNNKVYKIDEKSATHYVDKDLQTYSFELSFLDRNNILREGWFVNENLETDYYLLVYPHSNKKWFEITDTKDFTNVEYLLISKNKILEYLSSNGYDKERLKKISNAMRETKDTRFNTDRDFYFVQSIKDYMPETPVNVIIKKSRLIELADIHIKF